MEVKILEESKERLKIEIIGEDHTLGNVLSKELWNDKSVKVSGYKVDHPLMGNPILLVESDKDAKKALFEAVERVKKRNQQLLELSKKLH